MIFSIATIVLFAAYAKAGAGDAYAAQTSAAAAPPPPANQKVIRWQANQDLCLTPQESPAVGVAVNLLQCILPTAENQKWLYTADQQLQLKDTNYCLDAGVDPRNGIQMKLWDCYSDLPQQKWDIGKYLIRTANNQCLDLDSSIGVDNGWDTTKPDWLKIQTWDCNEENKQQQFFVV